MLLLVRVFVALSALLAFGFSAEVLGRPSNYKNAFDKSTTDADVKPNAVEKRVTGKVQAAYFTNWCVLYGPASSFFLLTILWKGHLWSEFP